MEAAIDYQRSNTDSAVYFGTKSYELALQKEDFWAAGRSQAILGRTKDIAGMDLEAIPNYFEALDLLNEADTLDYFTQYTVSYNIAAIQYHFGHFEKSSYYYSLALGFLSKHLKIYPTEAKKYRDHLLVHEVEYFLSQNEYRLGKLKSAAERLSALLATKGVPHRVRLNSLNKLGVIFGEFGESAKSIRSFEIIIEDPYSDSLRVGRAMHNVGAQYFKREEYLGAVKWYKKAIGFKERSGNNFSLFYSYLDLGETYLKLNESMKAISVLNKAIALEIDIATHPDRFIVYQFLGMALIDSNPGVALKQLNLYNSRLKAYQKSSDSLSIENKRRQFSTVLEAYMKKREHNDEINKKVQSFNRKGLLFSLLAVLSLCLTVILLLRKDKRGRQRFHKQMINTGSSD